MTPLASPSIASDVLEFIHQCSGISTRSQSRSSASATESDPRFNALALELFAWQFDKVPVYRRLCERRGHSPGSVAHWTEIPAVPAAAFKEFELTSIPPEERTVVFHSSGTTEQRPSRHFHSASSLKLYEASLLSWFARNISDIGNTTAHDLFRIVSLTPAPTQAPHSSLIHMFECVRRQFGARESVFAGSTGADGGWQLDSTQAHDALTAAPRAGKPLLILGTAFLFVHLIDTLVANGRRLNLPPASVALETGGYKGRSRSLARAELHRLISERLGIPGERIIREYGMSELSSQAYAVAGSDGEASFEFPPWARAQVVSPETGREVADGETGLIRIHDLANVCSVMAIQTEDIGVRCGNGFELIGRAALAEPRGCSLMTT